MSAMRRTKISQPAAVADDRPRKTSGLPTLDKQSEIARRAYDLYLARGCAHGHDVEDWLQAEREMHEGGSTEL